jgi:hypothetical protein
MTVNPQSQRKANDNRAERLCRKFMLVGVAAFLSTATTMTAGIILTNKAKAHLRKERAAYEHTQSRPPRTEIDAMVDKLAAYESNSVGPYHLVLDIHGRQWSVIAAALEDARWQATNKGPMAFAHYRELPYQVFCVGDNKYCDEIIRQDGATAALTSGPKAEAEEKASVGCGTSRVGDGSPAKSYVLHAKPVAKPATDAGSNDMCDVWPCWGTTLPKERP